MVTINTLNGGNIAVTLGSGTETYPRWVEPSYSNLFFSDDSEASDYSIGQELAYYSGHARLSGLDFYSHETIENDFSGVTVLNMYSSYEAAEDGGGYPQLTLYRQFLPGHWEDQNGNWVNGSWSNTTNNGRNWEGTRDSVATFYETESELANDSLSLDDIEAIGSRLPCWANNSFAVNYSNYDVKNLNVFKPWTGELFLRTWTNTVQPPNP